MAWKFDDVLSFMLAYVVREALARPGLRKQHPAPGQMLGSAEPSCPTFTHSCSRKAFVSCGPHTSPCAQCAKGIMPFVGLKGINFACKRLETCSHHCRLRRNRNLQTTWPSANLRSKLVLTEMHSALLSSTWLSVQPARAR